MTPTLTPALMLGLACILFLWAIILGIMLAFARFGKEANPPPVLVWWHGSFAVVGFLILLYGSFFVGYPLVANLGVILLSLAALFGFWMYFNYHRKEVLIPPPVVWGHGLVAVIGFLLIIAGMLNLQEANMESEERPMRAVIVYPIESTQKSAFDELRNVHLLALN